MNKEHNPIKAVATTDGELIVLADNYGFHVIPTAKMFEALKPYNHVTTGFYIHYRLNKESKATWYPPTGAAIRSTQVNYPTWHKPLPINFGRTLLTVLCISPVSLNNFNQPSCL